VTSDDDPRDGESEAEWRRRIRAIYGPGSDDLTPREEREYEQERKRKS
jgi:hypothetical protein